MNIKNQLFLLAIIIAILSQICSASKYNISLAELEKCKVYYIEGAQRNFIDFFEVNSVKNNLKNDNERLHLKFYLMANNTSNILLTHISYCNGVNCYQIDLDNNKSVIWRNGSYIKEKLSPNMLSTFHLMPVEIIQTNDGELIVNVPGYAEPLLKYLDPNPVDIKYFSFSSYRKTPAKWFYNCQFDENSNKGSQKICDSGVKNVSSINSGATAELKQEDCVNKQTNSKEKNNEDQLLLTSKLSAMDSRITNLTDYFLTEFVKKQTNYSEKYIEDQLLLTSKLSAMDSRITNLTDYFLTEFVKKQTNLSEKYNEDQLLLTSKISAMDSRITNLIDYILSDFVKKQTLSATDPYTKQLMDFFWSGVFNRHKTFFHSIVPTLNNFDDNQVIKFQAGVIELMQQIKHPSTTTTEKPTPMIDVRMGD